MLNCENSNANSNERKEVLGLHRITKKRLRELCKKDKLYQTPSLNDVLYLHYQGFQYIECLEEYTELKCLWLECNAITTIEGLENQSKLKCLFLQSNLIKRIDNLEHCPELDTLNLSSNHIRKIENCGNNILPHLNTLNLASNYLKDFDSLKHLENCLTLSVLDLSNNRIDDVLVVKIFSKIPQLRVLVLQGNPIVHKVPQYRKTIILECMELTYLDSRPVFPKDRALAEAWKRGGFEEERKENARWHRQERRKMREGVNATIRLRNLRRGPEDQESLLGDSDSEDDKPEERRLRQAERDADVKKELGLWDEIIEDMETVKTHDTITSSDMNKSSHISIVSTTDSNTVPNVHEKADETADIRNNTDSAEKIVNSAMELKKILDITEETDRKNILNIMPFKVEDNEENEAVPEQKSLKKVTFVEELNGNSNAAEESVMEQYIKSSSSDSDLEENIKEDFSSATEAIYNITINDLSCRETTNRKELEFDNMETSEDYEPEIEIKQMFERAFDSSPKVESNDKYLLIASTNESLRPSIKTARRLQYEKECEEVNRKVENDFKELSTNMDVVMVAMQQQQEKWETEAEALFDKYKEQKDSSLSSQTDSEENIIGNMRFKEERKDDKATLIVRKPLSQCNKKLNLEIMNVAPEDEISMVYQVKTENAPITASQQLLKLPEIKVTPPKEMTYDAKEIASKEKCETKMDVISEIQPTEAFKIYEKNMENLQSLLQKLEGEQKIPEDESADICKDLVEDLFNELSLTSTKIKNYEFPDLESDEELNYSDSPKEEENEPKTIRDVLNSFSSFLKDLGRQNKEEIKRQDIQRQTLVPTNKETVDSFKKLQNAPKLERIYGGNSKFLDEEKIESLKSLRNTRNLERIFGDSSESLDAQIELCKERKHRQVKRMVNRVYAQKEKYDDTLDVVDGKLVIVKKDTGEIEDITTLQSSYFSDSDEDITCNYDTAESFEIEDGATYVDKSISSRSPWTVYKPAYRESGAQMVLEALNQNVIKTETGETDGGDLYSMMAAPPNSIFNKPNEYKPREQWIMEALEQNVGKSVATDNDRETLYPLNMESLGSIVYNSNTKKSATQLVLEALNENSKEFKNFDKEEDSEEEEEEFFSLKPEGRNPIYALGTMDFDNIEIDDNDEKHIIECVCSYEGSKNFPKLTEGITDPSEPENYLVAQMVKVSNETEVAERSHSTAKQDLLLKKLLERTKKENEKSEELNNLGQNLSGCYLIKTGESFQTFSYALKEKEEGESFENFDNPEYINEMSAHGYYRDHVEAMITHELCSDHASQFNNETEIKIEKNHNTQIEIIKDYESDDADEEISRKKLEQLMKQYNNVRAYKRRNTVTTEQATQTNDSTKALKAESISTQTDSIEEMDENAIDVDIIAMPIHKLLEDEANQDSNIGEGKVRYAPRDVHTDNIKIINSEQFVIELVDEGFNPLGNRELEYEYKEQEKIGDMLSNKEEHVQFYGMEKKGKEGRSIKTDINIVVVNKEESGMNVEQNEEKQIIDHDNEEISGTAKDLQNSVSVRMGDEKKCGAGEGKKHKEKQLKGEDKDESFKEDNDLHNNENVSEIDKKHVKIGEDRKDQVRDVRDGEMEVRNGDEVPMIDKKEISMDEKKKNQEEKCDDKANTSSDQNIKTVESFSTCEVDLNLEQIVDGDIDDEIKNAFISESFDEASNNIEIIPLSTEHDVLECDLQVLDDDDSIVNEITVNAAVINYKF